MHIITTLPTKTKTGTPITVDAAKKQLQIEPEFTADDTFIADQIAIAIDKLEADTNSDILETTNTLIFKTERGFQCYTIPQAPLLSFTKLEKKITGGDWSEVATTDYEVTPGFNKFDLELLTNLEADQLKLTYKTGYAAANIPKVLRGAALLKISDLYDNERQGFRPMTVMSHDAYNTLIAKHIRTYWG